MVKGKRIGDRTTRNRIAALSGEAAFLSWLTRLKTCSFKLSITRNIVP